MLISLTYCGVTMSCTRIYFVFVYAYFFGAVSIALPAANSISSAATTGNETIWRRADYIHTPGVGTHKLHAEVATWNDARLNCHDEGASLVILNSIAEAQLIGQLINEAGKNSGWIGANDFYHEGEFVTIHDESLIEAGFDGWQPGEPNNAPPGEDCVSLHTSGRMNDERCDNKLAYACELPRIRSTVEIDWVQTTPSESQDLADAVINPTFHQSAASIHNIFNFYSANE